MDRIKAVLARLYCWVRGSHCERFIYDNASKQHLSVTSCGCRFCGANWLEIFDGREWYVIHQRHS